MSFDFSNYFLVFARAGAFVAVAPVLSLRQFPARFRIALGVFLALAITPILPPLSLRGIALSSALLTLAQEVLVGLALGFVCRLAFYALDFAGAIIGNEIGINIPSGMGAFSDSQSTVPAILLSYLAAMIFLGLNLHHDLLVAFRHSYALLPVGTARISESLLVEVIKRVSFTFDFGLRISAPFIAISFILALVFSLLGRAVSQINVFGESFSIRILVGLSVFGFVLQMMSQQIAGYLNQLPGDMATVARLLGGTGS
jgi:flagellar biosynthetic protein FliR